MRTPLASHNVIAMTASNAVALAVMAASYFLYSRLLGPSEFATYSAAIVIAKLGTTLLDGGLKTALVKHPSEVTPGGARALFLASSAGALMLGALLTAGLFAAWAGRQLSRPDAVFYGAYAASYFLTYPGLFLSLASLERRQRFTPVAKVEALTLVIEYALPAVLWTSVAPGFWSFALSAWIARACRMTLFLYAVPEREWLSHKVDPAWKEARGLFREGIAFQAAVAVSMLRDSLHLVMLGPWFGKAWAGVYAWGLQLCAVASQVFVQTASRVALPSLRGAPSSASRWSSTVRQVEWLTAFTAPALLLVAPAARILNAELFGAKWTEALPLMPFFVSRMIAGLATTPLGVLVLTEKDAVGYLRMNAAWTAAEVAVAVVLLALMGPMGLAVSYSFMAWSGVALALRLLAPGSNWGAILRAIFVRPSLVTAAFLVAVLSLVEYLLPTPRGTRLVPAVALFGLVTVLSYASEWRLLRNRAAEGARQRPKAASRAEAPTPGLSSSGAVRVAILLPTLGFGGHERMLVSWLRDACRSGSIEPLVHCRRNEPLIAECRRAGLEYRVDYASRSRGGFGKVLDGVRSVWITSRLLRRLPAREPVLFAPGVVQAAWMHMLVARVLGRCIIYYVPMAYSSSRMGFRYARVRDLLVGTIVRGVDVWITISEEQSELLRRAWGITAPVCIVPNRLDCLDEQAAPFRRAEASAAGRVKVLFLGRFDRLQKGLDWFAEVLLRDRHRWMDWMSVAFKGQGEFEPELRRVAARLGPSRASVSTWGDSTESLAQSDILILPSRFEGLPLVAIEAIWAGVAVVASDRSGLSGILPERCLFEFGNDAQLWSAVEALRDPVVRETVVGTARERLLATLPKDGFGSKVRAAVAEIRAAATSPAGRTTL